MKLDDHALTETLHGFRALALLGAREMEEIRALASDAFPFAPTLARAESIHVHVRVENVAALPRASIVAMGGQPENERPGYAKFRFASGVNVIFSSIALGEDDGQDRQRPFVDHVGIDLREDSPSSRALYDAVAEAAAREGWRHVAQGGPERAVECCYAAVPEKRWVYPPLGDGRWTRPVEVAYGALDVSLEGFGADLRPADPAIALAAPTACCAPAVAKPISLSMKKR